MRERIPVVVQGRGSRRRARFAGALWVVAEITVTLGVVVLLLVVHQLWWTNRQAREGAERRVHALEREWDASVGQAPEVAPSGEPPGGEDPPVAEGGGRDPGPRERESVRPPAPRWDQAYAVLRIPRLGVVAPVAQGISKQGVLDKGYIGHYPGTAHPGGGGNFAVAGHRNTHGEPFRHIDRLRKGDEIRVETRSAVYVYAVDRALTRTSPRDTGVIRPVPRSLVTPSAGYSAPGYYLTLTTCTPEYSSRYRLIVWGKLTSMRPR
ncbi:class E sortase [Streptomyces sp. AM8-1-1]|uniref:class E sortase n=1 Tax=Streptomyces sp. AM8-1-1 TaxID=3075825 RepID=UPI0028C4E785|nr:class E sortase [Streptomyces sp. AM8-1-1]WNO74379.1 class E sortase [Streptomyces sp. AM8-1-1]